MPEKHSEIIDPELLAQGAKEIWQQAQSPPTPEEMEISQLLASPEDADWERRPLV